MKRWTTSALLVALACTFGLLGGGIVMFLRPALASRNSAGTYSLATSAVTTLQVITPSLWNNTFNDLASSVTDSLDRNGRGGMLSALRGVDGTVAAPAFAYTSEAGSGEYRIGAGDLGWAILGGKKLELTGSLFTVTPNMTASGTLGVTSDFAVNTNKFNITASSGNTTIAGTLGLSDVLTQSVSGTGSTFLASFFEASLANGNNGTLVIGKSSSSNSAVGLSFTPNATAANSTGCLQVTGQSSTLCVDGNGKTRIGANGSNMQQVNFGFCTLNGGTPAQCTATVGTAAQCTANVITTTAANTRSLGTSNSSGTLTITSQTNGDTGNVAYFCGG